MPLLNEYIVSFRCNKNQNKFNIIHRIAPLLKIISLALIIPSLFNYYIFIAVGFVYIASILLNYYKWYLVYNYQYIIKDKILTIKKTYTYIKAKIYLQTKLNDITLCEIIESEQTQLYKDAICCYCDNSHFSVYIKLTINKQNYIILADNYFYSLLMMEDK